MSELKEILMRRDDMTSEEADSAIDEAKNLVLDGEDPDEILMDLFGLESDYFLDLMD